LTPSNRKNTRMTPLGRLLSLILILTIGAIAGAAGAAATRPHAQAWRCISVRPGETLWSMADGNPAPDRRETIQRILDHNALAGPPQAGAAIWVPNEGNLDGLAQVAADACPAIHPE
jgi:hypothetical protein